MTEERDGDRGRGWHDFTEDEQQQRYARVFTTMLSLGGGGFLAERQRKKELAERRRISKAADPMLAGVPAKRKGRAHPCC